MNEATPAAAIKPFGWKPFLRNTAYILGALLVFLFALELMLSSLQQLGSTAAETIILATSNPFTALFIGLLITAIIQSSTATTSMTVALVASGSLTLESAVPIIMGANVGTTITSTIVSLGFLPKKKEFRRAVAAGTYHDFFNILTVVILFPLEYYFQFLSSLSQTIATTFFNQQVGPTQGTFTLIGGGLSAITDWLVSSIGSGFIVVIVSLVLLFGSILFFRKVLTNLLGFGTPERFQRFFFQSPLKSFAWGVLTTAAIRSSSVTTSLVVPLVAKRFVKLRSAVPFILGANIGTTISAFLAAIVNSNTAISIAIAHFLFNLVGVLTFFPIPALREIPIRLASGLGRLTIRYRLAGLLYLLVTFFFIPFSLIYFNRDAVSVKELTYNRIEAGDTTSFKVIVKTFENQATSNWIHYAGTGTEPSQIYSVYRKNNLLIINNELFEMNRPGLCRDGEDRNGKFRMCITTILPDISLTPALAFDSVFVFEKKYDDASRESITSYISSADNLLIKKVRQDARGKVTLSEELSGILSK